MEAEQPVVSNEEIRLGKIESIRMKVWSPPKDQKVAGLLNDVEPPFSAIRHLLSGRPLRRKT